MKKFLIRIFAFSLIFFLLDKSLYFFLELSPSLEKDNRLEKIITGKMNKELIIIGSSRGARNILAGQIQDSLKITSYNLSYPGSNIEFHDFILSSLLKFNKSPKTIILAVDDPVELLYDKALVFRFDRLYPLAKYDFINDEMINKKKKNILSRILFIARLNKSNYNLRKKHFTKMDSIDSFGSMPTSIQKANINFVYNFNNNAYNSKNEIKSKINSFLNFQRMCEQKNIKLLIVFSPNFYNHNFFFEKRLKNLSLPFVQFHMYDSLNKAYKDKNFYYDESHLNRKGAIEFTNEIIKILK